MKNVRKSLTTVLERNKTFTREVFETEPYEAAWSTEARWFVSVMETSGEDVVVKLRPQVSPDGIQWCDGEWGPITIEGNGLYSRGMNNFGSWLRLLGEVHSGSVKLMISLALKE